MKTKEQPKLKLCPFCGGKSSRRVNDHQPHFHAPTTRFYDSGCEPCGIWSRGLTIEEADSKWNRRADGWKPVSEKPSDSRYVLVTDGNIMSLGIFDKFGMWYCLVYSAFNTTHWRELPPMSGKEDEA